VKTCTKCGLSKELSEFGKRARSKDGLTSRCSPCLAEDQRQLRADQGDRINAQRRSRDARPESIRSEWKREWKDRNREAENARVARWREQNPIKVRDSQLRIKFGITFTQYLALFEAQGWACAGCGSAGCATGMALAVDHDHNHCPEAAKSCGQCIRGLLCMGCNTADALAGGPYIDWKEFAA
jgi:hypothetical protein